MSRELQTVWKHTRTYAFGTFLNRAASLILIPLYAHVLTAGEFGVYALVVMAADMVGVVIGGGLSAGMARIYFDYGGQADRNRVVSTTMIGYCALGSMGCVLAHPLARISADFLFGNDEFSTIFLLSYLGVVFSVLFDLGLNYLRVIKKSFFYVIVSFLKMLLFLTLNIYLVLVVKAGVKGIVLGTLVSSLFLSLILTAYTLKQTGFSFSSGVLLRILRFGGPLLPATLADIALNSIDKYFLNRFVSVAMVGCYTLGNRIASVTYVFLAAPFAQIWIVRRLEALGEGTESKEFGRIFTYFTVLLTTLALGISLFAPEILRIVASIDYGYALKIIPILAVSYILFSFNGHFQISIFHAKKTEVVLGISLLCVLVNLVLNYLLIPSYGIMGAAIAFFLTNLTRLVLTASLGRVLGIYNMEFESGHVMKVLSLAMVIYGIGVTLLDGSVGILASMTKIVLMGMFLLAVILSGAVSLGDVRQIARIVLNRSQGCGG